MHRRYPHRLATRAISGSLILSIALLGTALLAGVHLENRHQHGLAMQSARNLMTSARAILEQQILDSQQLGNSLRPALTDALAGMRTGTHADPEAQLEQAAVALEERTGRTTLAFLLHPGDSRIAFSTRSDLPEFSLQHLLPQGHPALENLCASSGRVFMLGPLYLPADQSLVLLGLRCLDRPDTYAGLILRLHTADSITRPLHHLQQQITNLESIRVFFATDPSGSVDWLGNAAPPSSADIASQLQHENSIRHGIREIPAPHGNIGLLGTSPRSEATGIGNAPYRGIALQMHMDAWQGALVTQLPQIALLGTTLLIIGHWLLFLALRHRYQRPAQYILQRLEEQKPVRNPRLLERSDEIGALAQIAFSAHQVHQHQKLLLESQVAQRTRDLQQTIDDLQASCVLLDQTLEIAGMASLSWHPQSGRFRNSPQLHTLMDWHVHELEDVLRLLYPPDRARLEHCLQHLVERRIDSCREQVRLRNRPETSLEFRARRLQAPGGSQRTWIVANVQDISDQERERQRTEQRERMLAHQSKLAAMGDMIGNIAHQWRQPLAEIGSILMNLHIRHRSGGLETHFIQEQIGQANLLLRSMSETIDSFRSFYQPDHHPESFDPEQAIDESLRILHASLTQRDIQFSRLTDCTTVRIQGVRNNFSQGILNLLSNACNILEERSVRPARIELRTRCTSNRYHVSISDNGGGIAPADLPRIFEAYFTTRSASYGTGLGLYMAHLIFCEQMRGTLRASNTYDGACFQISIPLEAKRP